MTKKQAAVITFLSIASLVLGLLISRRLWFRLDLTRHKAYTISKLSRNLYAEIPDQVRITYYLSDELASVHPMPGEIEDLIREYTAYSGGRIQFVRKDPAKTGQVRAVEQLGIMPQQIQTIEEDRASVATVYTGITVEYLDKVEVLPVVFSLDTLEYDLSSRILTLTRGTVRDLGVITGDSYRQWESDYGYLNAALIRSGFRVRSIPPGEEIPDTLGVLFVLGGAEDLDEWDLYRIDRYIQGGGKVFFALESVFVDLQGGLEARLMNDKGLLSMVSFYGATARPALVLDKSALVISYEVMGSGGIVQRKRARYAHWIGALNRNGNREHPVTARFSGIDMFWASPLEITAPESVKAEALFSSTPEAWLMTKNFATNPDMAYLFEQEAPDTRGPKVLGAALSGIFPSWFAGLPKPVREGASQELPDLPVEPKPARIIVVGDTDFAGPFIGEGRQGNLEFLLQAADWLGNDDDIIGIRNRLDRQGRLDKIIEPEKRAAAIGFARITNVFFIPLGVIALGIYLAGKRKARAAGSPETAAGPSEKVPGKEFPDGV
jgi:ABC-type uncharacterized transport system involved in gliding motility auxiliary subunit